MWMAGLDAVSSSGTPNPGSGGDIVSDLFHSLLKSAETSPLFIWIAFPLVTIFAISLLFPQVLGNFSKTVSSWGENRRRSSSTRDNFTITDLDGQRTYLQKEIDELRGENNGLRDEIDAWNKQSMIHAAWDWEARTELTKTDPDYPMPPAIRPKRENNVS